MMNYDHSTSATGVAERVYSNKGNIWVLAAIPLAAKNILDVGCGAGDNARVLQERGHIVDGITLSSEEAEEAKKFCRHVLIYNLENGLPPELVESYDAIICSHVLEHICWPQKLLSDIKDKLFDSGGFCIVALPNIMAWRYRIPILSGKFEYTPTGTMDETHFRWYTFRSAQILFQRHGFKINKAWVESAFPLYFFRKILPKSLVRRIDVNSGRISPGFFGNQMLFKITVRDSKRELN